MCQMTSSAASGPAGYSPNIRAILAGLPKGDLDTTAHCADRIIEASHQPALARVEPLPESNTLMQRIENLACQVAALSTELAHLRSSSRNRHSGNRSSSRDDATSTLCWYHCHYGARAQKCTQPCSYWRQENPTQRTATVAHVCITTTGHLFITDRISKRRFLVDTGSDLCVYHHRLIQQHRERVNYDLCVANGTIPTYGWLSLSLNLGLRRNFMWQFVLFDAT
jgi:hypothetical protein